MNILDMRTVFFSYVISSIISMAVMASLWPQNRRRSPELGFWLADFSMQFTGLLLSLLRGNLPDFFSMVISNILILGGTLLLLIGLERYTGKNGPQWHNALFLGVFILVQIYFVYIQPSLQARNINVSLGIIFLCAQCAWLLLRRVDPGMRTSTRPTGVIFSTFCLVGLVRIFVSLAAPADYDFFKSGLYDTLVILTYQMLYIGLTFVLFLMVNRRLLTSLENDLVEIKKAEETLKESEEKFSKAFQTSPYAITITRAADGQFIEINDTFTAITGIAREDALADSSLGLNLWVNAEDRQRIVATLRAGASVDGQEFQFRRKNGEILTGLFSARMLPLNQVPCILSSIDDITAHKQAEQQLKQYSEHLEEMVTERTRELQEAQQQLVRHEKLAVLGQMAGSVGHELRNPLAVINTAIYYLKMVQPDADEKIKKYHSTIEREVHNADKIIADLLDFARGVTAEPKPVAILELVQGVLERFPAPAWVEVNLEIPADLPLVFADPHQMEQVLGNLVVNACQAMASTSSATGVKNGGKLTLSAHMVVPVTERDLQKEMLAIAVKDTGTGITPENMQKLFEPLFTTKTRGIGLGLAVSRKLTEANGGRIEVESEPGKGSTFTLWLPVKQTDEVK